MHPTSAASRANSTASRGTQRLPRLPAYPSHSLSLVRFLVCLPPVVTYQPIPSHLSCARAALRSQSSSQSYPFPPSLFPRPFFRPYPAEPGHSAQKEASQPVRRPLPPPPKSYIYLQVLHRPLGFDNSPAVLVFPTPTVTLDSALARLDCTHKQHQRPPPRSFRRSDRSQTRAPVPQPICVSRLSPSWTSRGDHILRPRRTNIGANAAQSGEHSGVIGPGPRLPRNGPRLANRSWRRHS